MKQLIFHALPCCLFDLAYFFLPSFIESHHEAAHFSFCLGCAVVLLPCCLFDLAYFFLPSFSH